ncbi:p450 domain-containing protein, partial [Cephalotus follicularis]
LPPGPRKLPLIGYLHQLGDVPQKSLLHLSTKYGPLMFLQLGSMPTLVVSSVDATRDIFKSHDIIFSGRPELYTAKKMTYDFIDISLAPYSDQWRELRKIAVIELLSTNRVQSFEAV